ncbi:MAG: sigma-70 family RNA polymerase sigma factor [Cyclobacteriaceae bacterium]
MELASENQQFFERIVREDDERAFTIFFERYHAKLIQFALLFVPHIEQAEDVISNVLIRLIKNADKVFKMHNLEGYLFISVKNEALNFLKKEGKHKLNVIDQDSDFHSHEYVDPMEKLLEKELRQLITRTVEGFPPKRKMVYKLIKDEGLKYKEVATLMDLSKRTVEVHLKLAIKELRATVRKYMADKKPGTSYMNVARMAYSVLMIG